MSNIIKDSNGKGVAGALIHFKQNGEEVKLCQTDAEGYFHTNLGVGDYSFNVEAHNFEEYNDTCTVTEEGLNLEITLVRSVVTANIKVINDYGDFLSDCSVHLVRKDYEEEFYDLTTNSSGVCSVRLKCATYVFVFNLTGYSEEIVEFEFTKDTTELVQTLFFDKSLLNSFKVGVKNHDTGSVLAGVSVRLTGPKSASSVTGDDGLVDFRNILYRGVYNIHCGKTGYSSYDKPDVHIFKDNLREDVELLPETVKPLFKVNVSDENGVPLRNAVVDLKINEEVEYSAISDSYGVASFTNIDCNTYIVKVSLTGYITHTEEYMVSYDCDDLNVTLVEEAPVKGDLSIKVMDESTGTSLQGVLVTATPVSGGSSLTKYTNYIGECTFSNLAFDQYNIKCEFNDYESKTVTVDFTETTQVMVDLKAIPKQDLSIITQTHTGDVISRVPAVTVTVKDNEGTVVASGTTDFNGGFTAQKLVIGDTYSINAFKTGYEAVNRTITITESTHSLTLEMTKRGGTPTTQKVTVVDEESLAPISGASVKFIGASSTTYSGTTNNNGEVTISNVAIGDYTLEVSKNGYITHSQELPIVIDGIHNVYLVKEGTIVDNVLFTVKDFNNEDPISADVIITDNKEHTYSGTSDIYGIISFDNVPAGNYVVTAENPAYDYYRTELIITPDDCIFDIDMVSKGLGIIIVDADTQAGIVDAGVTVHGSGSGFSETGFTQEHGGISFKNAPFDNYRIDISHDEYASMFEFFDYTVYSGGFRFEMTRNKSHVQIGVTDHDTSNPIKEVNVGLVYDEETHFEGTTNNEGLVVFENVPFGYYSVNLSHPGYNDRREELRVASADISIGYSMNKAEVVTNQDFYVSDIETGASLGGIVVKISNDSYSFDHMTTDDGEAHFENVPVGHYTVTATGGDGSPYKKYTSEMDIVEDSPLFEIQMSKKAVMSFRIKDSATEEAIKDVYIAISSTSYSNNGKTDENGELVFATAPYGDYNITLTHPQYSTITIAKTFTEDSEVFEFEMNRMKSHVQIGVLDNDTSNPIVGANVVLTYKTYLFEGTTNNEGNVIFEDVPYGQYFVNMSHPEYIDGTGELNVENTSVSTAFTLVHSDIRTIQDFYVYDANTEESLAGVTVKISNDKYTANHVTDDEGDVSFENVPVGRYMVTVTAPTESQYKTYTSEIDIVEDSTLFEIGLSKPNDMSFRIIEKTTNNPIQDAKVIVEATGYNDTRTTDIDGETTFRGVPYGNCNVIITHPKYTSITKTIPFAEDSGTFELEMTIATSKVDISVKDNVTTRSFSGVGVTLTCGETVIKGTTGDNGTVSFNNVPYDTYTVSLTHTGYVVLSEELVVNESTIQKEYVLNPIRSTQEIIVIDNETGEVVNGIVVKISNDKYTAEQTTVTAGKVSFANVPVGAYNVTATDQNKHYRTYTALVNIVFNSPSYEVKLTKNSDLSFRIIEKTTNNPIQDVTIVIETEGYSKTGTTDANGELTFKEAPYSDYNITVTHQKYNKITKGISFDSESSTFELEMTRLTGKVDIGVEDGLTSEGFSGVTVKLTCGPTILKGTTNNEGTVAFNNVPYDTYTIELTYTGYETITKEITINSGTFKRDYSLNPIRTTQEISVIDGSSKETLTGINVKIINEKYNDTQSTSSGGKVSFSNVPIGVYNVIASDQYGRYKEYVDTINIVPDSPLYEVRMVKNASLGFRITDKINKKPIQDASIVVETDGYSKTGTTDENGELIFENAPYGGYNISITHQKYNKIVKGISFDSESSTFELEMTRLTGKVNINVKDDLTSKAFMGANVSLTCGDIVFEDITNKNGIVSFANVPYYTYTLKINYSGYTDITEEFTVDSGSISKSYTLVAIRTTQEFLVVDDNDNPISGSKVGISNVKYSSEKTTGNDGKVSFDNIPIGTYAITATDDYHTKYESTIEIHKDATIITIKMHKLMSSVNIRVLDDELLTDVVGVNVIMTCESDVFEGITNEQGMVTFENVPYGTYTVEMSRLGYNTKTEELIVDEVSKGVIYHLVPESKFFTQTFTVLNNDDLRAVAGAEVELSGPASSYSGVTDEKGQVKLMNVATSPYILNITKGGFWNYTDNISVSEDKEYNIQLTPNKMSFNVIDRYSKKVVTNAHVKIESDTHSDEAYTDDDGNVVFSQVLFGTYLVTLTKEDYYDYTLTVTFNDSFKPREIGMSKLKTEIRIKTIDSEEKALSSAKVVLTSDDNTFEGSTDVYGLVTFSQCPYGHYNVSVVRAGYYEKTDEFDIHSPTMSIAYILEKADVSNQTIHVIDSSSEEPVAGASVSLTSYDDSYSGDTDVNGRVSFMDVKPNVYNLNITKAEYMNYRGLLQVSGDKETTIKLAKVGTPVDTIFYANNIATGIPISADVILKQDGEVIKEGVTNQDGVLTIENVPSGEYNLTVKNANYHEYNTDITVSPIYYEFHANMRKLDGASVLVRDKDTKEGIANLKLFIETDTSGYSAVTDSHGAITFTNIPYGECELTVNDGTQSEKNPDYETIFVMINYTADSDVFVIDLPAVDTREKCEITVKDEYTNEIVPNATVKLEGATSFEAQTNENGKVLWFNVPYGDYSLSVSKDGYDIYQSDKSIRGSATIKVNLIISVNDVIIDTKSGTEVLADVDVAVYDKNTKAVIYEGVSDNTGMVGPIVNVFKLGRSYIIKGTKETYNDASLEVRIEKTTSNIKLNLMKEHTATVLVNTLRKGSRTFVRDINVKLSNEDYTFTGKTNEEGELQITGVPYGDYNLKGSHNLYINTTEAVTVTPGLNEFDIILEPTHPVNVLFKVTEEATGENIKGAIVDVKDDDGALIATGNTDTHGEFTVNNLGMGKTYKVDCSKHLYYFESATCTIDDTKTVNIKMAHSSKTLAREEITVVDKLTDEPVTNALVNFKGNGFEETALTSNEGMVVFNNLKTGSYKITIDANEYNPYEADIQLDSDNKLTIQLTPKTSSFINLFIQDENQDFVEGATVTIDAGHIYTGVTNADGFIRFDPVPLLVADVTASKEGYESNTVRILLKDTVTFTICKIIVKDAYVLIEDDVTQSPVLGVEVKLSRDGQEDVIGVTNSEGKFLLPEMLPGTYNVNGHYTGRDYFEDITLEGVELTPENKEIYSLIVFKKFNNMVFKMLDSETEEPLSDVEITLEGEEKKLPVLSYSGVTDAEGNAYFPSVANMVYEANFYHETYKHIPVILMPRELVELYMQYNEVPTSAKVMIFDWKTEEPIDVDVVVQFKKDPSTPSIEARRTGFGTYEVSEILSGYYDINVDTTSDYKGVLLSKQLVSVDSEKNVYDAYLLADADVKKSIKVNITDDLDNPIEEDTAVKLISVHTKDPVLEPSRIEGNVYFFDEVPEGDYSLECISESEHYDTVIQDVTIEDDFQTFNIIMPRSCCYNLDIKVEDKYGEPVIDAAVVISYVDGDIVIADYTDDTGIVHIPEIHKGVFNFNIRSPEERIVTHREITPDTKLLRFVIGLDTVPLITFEVYDDETESLVGGANIKLTNEYWDLEATENTIENCPVGDFTLNIKADGYKDYSSVETITKSTTTIQAYLKKPKKLDSVTIQVNDQFDDAVKDAHVVISNNSDVNNEYSGFTDENGKILFRETVLDGSYDLNVQKAGFADFVKKNVVFEEPVIVETLNLTPTSIITYDANINVVESGSTPVEGADITLTDVYGETTFGITDENGKDKFSSLPEGKYSINITKEKYNTYEAEFNLTDESEYTFEIELETVEVLITPVNALTEGDVPSDSIVLKDAKGSVISAITTKELYSYRVKLPRMVLVPYFTGKYFGTIESDWRVDETIDVTTATEGEEFKVKTRPLTYVTFMSVDKNENLLPCSMRMVDEETGWVMYDGIISTGKLGPTIMIFDDDKLYRKFRITCYTPPVEGYPHIIEKTTDVITIGCGEDRTEKIVNGGYVNNCKLTLVSSSILFSGSYTITDAKGRKLNGTLNIGNSFDIPISEANLLVPGTAHIEASGATPSLSTRAIDTYIDLQTDASYTLNFK